MIKQFFRPMSNRVYRSTIFRNLWKRRRPAAGRFPAADWSLICRPDAFHQQWVTGWRLVTGWRPGCRQWNAPSRSLEMAPFDRSHTSSIDFLQQLCPVFYRFRDKARCWKKIATVHTSPIFDVPVMGFQFPSEYCYSIWYEQVEWWVYPMMKKIVNRFISFEYTNVTDGQTLYYDIGTLCIAHNFICVAWQ